MGTSLQDYLAEEEHRHRVIKRIILIGVAVLILLGIGYLLFNNYPEKRVAEGFLSELNSGKYQQAYEDWGCTAAHPCPNYDYSRFLNDWGPSKKSSTAWKIASVDGCRTFVTVNVQSQGSELESLAIQRNDKSLSFAPAPECQEKQWHWKQFFHRIFGGGS